MRKAIRSTASLAAVVVAMLVIGCSTPAPRHPGADLLRIDAQVTWVDLEGGFWGLVAEDGTRYDPPAIPRRFQRDGLPVHVVAKPVDGLTARMWGQPVRVLRIGSAEE